MKTLRGDTAHEPRGLARRMFGRFGSTAILNVVLLVVVGWIGLLGRALMWLLG